MPVNSVTHRIRTGLYNGAKKNNEFLNLLTILMVNLLLKFGPKSISLIILILCILPTYTTIMPRNNQNSPKSNNESKYYDSRLHMPPHKNTSSLTWTMTIISIYIIYILLLLCGDIEQNPGPPVINHDNDSSLDSLHAYLEKSVTLIHLNVQSICNKLDIIQAEFGGFDIITLNETWLDNNTTSETLMIQGL